MSITEKLKHYLDTKCISVQKLAEVLGVNEKELNYLLNGNFKMDAILLASICKVIGIRVEMLHE